VHEPVIAHPGPDESDRDGGIEPLVRDLGLPPDAVFFLLARSVLDLAADRLEADLDLACGFDGRLDEATAEEAASVMAEYQAAADELTAEVFVEHDEATLAGCFSSTASPSTGAMSAGGSTSSVPRPGGTLPISRPRASSTSRPAS